MYQAAEQFPQQSQVIFTENAIQRFDGINCRTSSLLNEIQEKLHKIISLRTPDKMSTPSEVAPMPNDFASALDVKLNEAQQNEDKLERILKHLCQIA